MTQLRRRKGRPEDSVSLATRDKPIPLHFNSEATRQAMITRNVVRTTTTSGRHDGSSSLGSTNSEQRDITSEDFKRPSPQPEEPKDQLSPIFETSPLRRGKSTIYKRPNILLQQGGRKSRKRRRTRSYEEDTLSSESELESDSSTSDSEISTQNDCDSNQEVGEDELEISLPAGHIYRAFRLDLVQFIYTLFVIWMSTVRYIIPPDHRLKRPRKRARMDMFIEEADPEDPGTLLVSRFQGYHHLGCPFYKHNPCRHRRCILEHSLQSIGDVVYHVRECHPEPPFCQICGRLFENLKGRNDHLRRDVCQRRDNIEFDGVSLYQQDKIARQDDPEKTEARRWDRIYKTIFGHKPRTSPYLMEGEGFKLSLLRDYWSENGENLVRQYLNNHGRHEEDGQGNEFTGLCALVRGDLIRKAADVGEEKE